MADHWIQGAVKPSHRGLLKKRAAAAGESLSVFMKQHHKNPTIQKEVNLAKVFRRMAERRKHGQ